MDQETFQRRMDDALGLGLATTAIQAISEPQTQQESDLQQVIGSILNIPPQHVILSRSFISLGGDSLSAMRVVSTCTRRGMEITAKTLLTEASLTAVAAGMTMREPTSSGSDGIAMAGDGGRFSLLGLDDDRLRKLEAALDVSVGDARLVEDCYPCTPVQEGIIISQTRDSSIYNIMVAWELGTTNQVISLEHFQAAWASVVQHHTSLRTGFIESLRDSGLFDQVIYKHPMVDVVRMPWVDFSSCIGDVLELTANTWKPGRPQHRLEIIENADGRVCCKLLISHALVDGLSIPALRWDFERALNGTLSNSRAQTILSIFAAYKLHRKRPHMSFGLPILKATTGACCPG